MCTTHWTPSAPFLLNTYVRSGRNTGAYVKHCQGSWPCRRRRAAVSQRKGMMDISSVVRLNLDDWPASWNVSVDALDAAVVTSRIPAPLYQRHMSDVLATHRSMSPYLLRLMCQSGGFFHCVTPHRDALPSPLLSCLYYPNAYLSARRPHFSIKITVLVVRCV